MKSKAVAFIVTYEKQSISGAAKACFIAQPSISAAIAQLETTLNKNLFIRHARGVTPTREAEKLYPLAKKLLGQADAIKGLFREQSDKHLFNLGVTRGLGVERMSALLKDFTGAQANMELTLLPPEEVCDARIITKEELKAEEQFVSLWQEDYLLAIPYSNPLSLKEVIDVNDLDNCPFIYRLPCTAWPQLKQAMDEQGVTADIRANIQTIDYALGLVRAEVGIALVPAHAEVLAKTDISYRPINKLHLRREIVFAFKEKSETINLLIKEVKKHRHL
jgi:DNA-binding transcriptional LysR family regulator